MLKTADDMIREVQPHIECVDVAMAKKIYDENPDAVIVDVRETPAGKHRHFDSLWWRRTCLAGSSYPAANRL